MKSELVFEFKFNRTAMFNGIAKQKQLLQRLESTEPIDCSSCSNSFLV